MKTRPYHLAIAAAIAISTRNIWLESAQSQPNRSQPQTLVTISGEVKVNFAKNSPRGSFKCQDILAELSSDRQPPNVADLQKLPPAQAQQIAELSKMPLFSYGTNLKGNLTSGSCNYKISIDPKYIGQKARLKFSQFTMSTGKSNKSITPDLELTIPSQPTKLDTKIVFSN